MHSTCYRTVCLQLKKFGWVISEGLFDEKGILFILEIFLNIQILWHIDGQRIHIKKTNTNVFAFCLSYSGVKTLPKRCDFQATVWVGK